MIFFVYTGVELTAGQWAFALLTEARGLSTASAGFWAGLFWASRGTGWGTGAASEQLPAGPEGDPGRDGSPN